MINKKLVEELIERHATCTSVLNDMLKPEANLEELFHRYVEGFYEIARKPIDRSEFNNN